MTGSVRDVAFFVVHAIDKPGMQEARTACRPAHRARLRDPGADLVVRIGGPLTDSGGSMIGTMLIVEAENRAIVEDFIAGDPYSLAGIYATVRIDPFNWGLTNLPTEGAARG